MGRGSQNSDGQRHSTGVLATFLHPQNSYQWNQAVMARIQQPREKAELRGSDKRNPQRYKGEVPKSTSPLGSAPDHMSEDAKAVWFELEALSIPGVLTAADRWFVEFACNLMAEYRRNPDEFKTNRFAPMYTALAKLGFSPADRQKLAVDKPPQTNPYANLDA